MKLPISLILVAFGFMLSSGTCNKNTNKPCQHEVAINYEGPVAGDGCDWVLTIEGQRYHPEFLAANFKQDGMHAYCDYTLTGDTFYCGLMPTKMPVVQITCFKFPDE